MDQPAILAEALSKRYAPDAPPAVDGLSFSMPRGATWGLLGGNGAGKTTTIAMLLGLLVPSGGRITVLGHDMARDRFTALAERRIGELAAQLQLTDLLDRPAGQLSAGQKTRVALAKSLVNRPELLLLDEPTASLDPDTGDWVRSWLERYRTETGCSILLASHNMAEVERLCNHVLMLKQGRMVDSGSPAELLGKYGRNDLEQVFLDIARGRQRVPA
jgi:ABC-2 type transport system ATP-binding protein